MLKADQPLMPVEKAYFEVCEMRKQLNKTARMLREMLPDREEIPLRGYITDPRNGKRHYWRNQQGRGRQAGRRDQ